LEPQLAIGSPVIGLELGTEGLSAWRLDGFPLPVWYFERADQGLVVRLVGSVRKRNSSTSPSTESSGTPRDTLSADRASAAATRK